MHSRLPKPDCNYPSFCSSEDEDVICAGMSAAGLSLAPRFPEHPLWAGGLGVLHWGAGTETKQTVLSPGVRSAAEDWGWGHNRWAQRECNKSSRCRPVKPWKDSRGIWTTLVGAGGGEVFHVWVWHEPRCGSGNWREGFGCEDSKSSLET